MVSFMKNQIETSITSGAFQDIILEDIVSTSTVCNQIHFLQLFIVFLNFIFSIFVYFLYCIIFYIVIVVLFMFMFM
jgi:hypothetical protein